MDQEEHINFAHFKGTLTRKPVLKGTEKKVALLNIACKRDYQNENGKTNADFISLKVWKDAEKLVETLNEGQLIEVETHVRTSSYTKENGEKVYNTDFVVDKIDYSFEMEKETKKSKSKEKEVMEK